MAENGKVFISYSRDDSSFVADLAKRMRDAGVDLWLDALDISMGRSWDDEIEQALKACPRFLVVLTPEAVASRNVRDEISEALERGAHIIPVLLRPCEVPFRIKRLQRFDFTGDRESELARLVAALSGAPARPLPPSPAPRPPQTLPAPESTRSPPPPLPPPFSPAPQGRLIRIVVVLGVAIALGAGIYWALRSKTMETEPIAVAPAGDTTPDPVKKPLVATPTLDDLNLAGTWGLKVDGRDEGELTIEKAGQVLTLIARRSNASSTPFAFGTVSWSGKKLVFTSADANPFLVTLLAVEQGQWVVTASRRVSGGGEKEEYRTVVKGSARNEPDWKTWTADLVEATENPGRTGHLDVTLAHDGSTLTAHWSVGQGRVEFILTRR